MATLRSPGSNQITASRFGSGSWKGFDAAGNSVKLGRTEAGMPKLGRTSITSGKNQVFRAFGSTYHVEVHLHGFRTLIAHHAVAGPLLKSLVAQVTYYAGTFVRDSAIEDSTFQDDTGETRNSLRTNNPIVYASGDDFVADIGPRTYYAPFLEFGWSKGGNYYSYPFMVPALYKHKIDFINGLIDAVSVVTGERPYALRPPMGNQSTITSTISSTRKWLYTNEKALGDIAVIAGSRYIGSVRGVMLSMAKELGDLQAIMNHAVGARITTRIRGSVTGRGLGYTRTISHSATYSGYPGGGNSNSVGHRVYNRVSGRATRGFAVGR